MIELHEIDNNLTEELEGDTTIVDPKVIDVLKNGISCVVNRIAYLIVPTKTSDLTNDSGFLTEHQSLLDYAKKTWVEAKGYLTEHQSLSAYRTSSAQDEIDNSLDNRLDAIESVIPDQATSSNKLADKDFVNSSITTNTSTFRGTSVEGLNETQFLAWANGLTKTNNDYVFWNTTDANGNVVYKRYKYNGTNWVYEYTLNNSSFTAVQWSAINSGATSEKIAEIDEKADLTDLPTKTSDLTNDSGFIDNTYHDSTKVDVVEGKGLSTNDYTTNDKNKLGAYSVDVWTIEYEDDTTETINVVVSNG